MCFFFLACSSALASVVVGYGVDLGLIDYRAVLFPVSYWHICLNTVNMGGPVYTRNILDDIILSSILNWINSLAIQP